MCERKPNESLIVYLLHYVAERPQVILAVIGLVAAGYMYVDLRKFITEQTMAFRDVALQLQEMNVRIQHLEREHEFSRTNGNQ